MGCEGERNRSRPEHRQLLPHRLDSMPPVAVRREYQGADGWEPPVQSELHPTPEYEWRSRPHDRLHRWTDPVGALHRRLLLLQGGPEVGRTFLNRGCEIVHAEGEGL